MTTAAEKRYMGRVALRIQLYFVGQCNKTWEGMEAFD